MMKQILIKTSLLSLFLLILQTGWATISLVEVVPTQPGANTGKITVEIGGAAISNGEIAFDVSIANNTDPSDPLFSESVIEPGQLTFEPLAAGTYTISFEDSFGCETELTVTIYEDICVLDIAIINLTHVSYCNNTAKCNNGIIECKADGVIEIAVQSSNNETFSIEWTKERDSEYSATGSRIEDLEIGTYIVKIQSDALPNCVLEEEIVIDVCMETIYEEPRDVNGCFDRRLHENLTINLENITGATGVTDDNPNGKHDGKIAIEITSNNDLFDFYWKGPEGEIFNTEDLTNLAPGEYCLMVEDGCTARAPMCYTVVDCSAMPIVVDAIVTGACETGGGKVEFDITGGTEPYQVTTPFYLLGEPGNYTGGYAEGEYMFRISDVNNCAKEIKVTVPKVLPITANLEVIPLGGYNSFGLLNIKVMGGDRAYEVEIIGEGSTQQFLLNNTEDDGMLKEEGSLQIKIEKAGTYKVRIYGESGCAYEADVTIHDCGENEDPLVVQQEFNEANILDLFIDGGLAPYQVNTTWEDRSNEEQLANSDWHTTVATKGWHRALIPVNNNGRLWIEVIDGCGQVEKIFRDVGIPYCGFHSERHSSDEMKVFANHDLIFKVDDGCWDDCDKYREEHRDCSKVEITKLGLSNLIGQTKVIIRNAEEDGEDNEEEDNIEELSWFIGDSDKHIWEAPDIGTYTIRVEQWFNVPISDEDGDTPPTCVLEFEVSFAQGGIPSYGFARNYDGIYNGYFKCNSCIPSSEDGILTDDDECERPFTNADRFSFIPENPDDPCNGGGTFVAYRKNENGDIVPVSFTVPPGVAVGQESYRGGSVGVAAPNNFCEFGTKCFFDSNNIGGLEFLNGTLEMQFCNFPGVRPDLPTDPLPDLEDPFGDSDSETDEPIDVSEEEGCGSPLVAVEIPEQCERRFYCERNDPDGEVRRILIRTEQTMEATLCRIVSKNTGNTLFLAGRCGCSPTVIDGHERVRVEMEDVENSEMYPICEDINMDLGCDNGGVIVEESKTNLWFLKSSTTTNQSGSTIFPNPFSQTSTLTIKSEKDKVIIISIIDVFGLVVYEDYINTTSDGSVFTIDQLKDYPTGIYYVLVQDALSGTSDVHKVVKVATN